MLLTEVEIQQSDQQVEEFDRSAGRRAMLARGERTSCLRTGGSMSVICVGDTELAEHSDEEWYPPTPPLYDVTDKLRYLTLLSAQPQSSPHKVIYITGR